MKGVGDSGGRQTPRRDGRMAGGEPATLWRPAGFQGLATAEVLAAKNVPPTWENTMNGKRREGPHMPNSSKINGHQAPAIGVAMDLLTASSIGRR